MINPNVDIEESTTSVEVIFDGKGGVNAESVQSEKGIVDGRGGVNDGVAVCLFCTFLLILLGTILSE